MDQIIGHDKLKGVFERLVERGTLSHAYLFVGPDSVGKTSFIRALCASLLEVSADQLESHQDVLWVRAPIDEKTGLRKSTLPVESIRRLREQLSMSALHGGWRVAVIEDAGAMNLAAANALLKILEEPPKRTLIFLRATRTDHLPQTIASRTQVVRMHGVASEVIVNALVKRGASTKEARDLARIAAGRPGMALRFFTDRQVYADWRTRAEMFANQFDKDAASRLVFAKNLLSKNQLRDHDLGEAIFATWEAVLREQLLADQTSSRWHRALSSLQESRQAFARHTPLQLAFEHTLLHL